MPSAIEQTYQQDVEKFGRAGQVGKRELPSVKLAYYARAPKSNVFGTIWMPMNASNRIVTDKNQDVMHLYYSRHLYDKPAKKGRTSAPFRLDNRLDIPAKHETEDMPPRKPQDEPDSVKAAMWMTNTNSQAPFASIGKPTCGYYFSRQTDNKKRLTGIPPTNTVKWRSHNTNSTPN